MSDEWYEQPGWKYVMGLMCEAELERRWLANFLQKLKDQRGIPGPTLAKSSSITAVSHP